jgi:hypothetical protein
VTNYDSDRATLPNAGYPPSSLSFFLYSAYLEAYKALSHERYFRGGVTEHKMPVLIFSTLVRNISHSKKNCMSMTKNVYWSSCKAPRNTLQILISLNALDIFSKNLKYKNSMEICHVRAELFQEDGQT